MDVLWVAVKKGQDLCIITKCWRMREKDAVVVDIDAIGVPEGTL